MDPINDSMGNPMAFQLQVPMQPTLSLNHQRMIMIQYYFTINWPLFRVHIKHYPISPLINYSIIQHDYLSAMDNHFSLVLGDNYACPLVLDDYSSNASPTSWFVVVIDHSHWHPLVWEIIIYWSILVIHWSLSWPMCAIGAIHCPPPVFPREDVLTSPSNSRSKSWHAPPAMLSGCS